MYIYIYIYIYTYMGTRVFRPPYFLNLLTFECVSKSLAGTMNLNIMILSRFKFTAQDNGNCVFFVCVPSIYGEGQIHCAGQQKQLANAPIH